MWGQHRGGLIKDEDLGLAYQGLDDFYTLLHTDRQVFNHCVRVNVKTVAVRDFADLLAGDLQVQHSAGLGGFGAEGNVFCHGEHRNEHEVLVHHADAGGHGIARSRELNGVSIKQDFALGRLV